jgi:hypothetical protein
MRLWQSDPTTQAFPSPHRVHTPPPQSAAVSAPSRAPLLHDAIGAQAEIVQVPLAQSSPVTHRVPAGPRPHRPFVHSSLAQSVRTTHTLPAPHVAQFPPQSVLVSAPFRTPSVHGSIAG